MCPRMCAQVPRAGGSPPVPVMHSPPRAVSVKEQADWKIPPCISNWKNAKGYTIPLDKRLAADGRGLQETAINDNFAKMTEALYVAEQQARQVCVLHVARMRTLLPGLFWASTTVTGTPPMRAYVAGEQRVVNSCIQEHNLGWFLLGVWLRFGWSRTSNTGRYFT